MSKGHNHQYKEVHSKEHEHHENECCCHKEHEHHENESCCHKEHKHHENECCCHKEHEHHDKHCHCGEEHDHKHDHSHNHDSDEGCGCGRGHDHEHGGNVESKDIAKIFLATALLVIAVFTGKYAGSLADKTGISLGTAETVSLLLYLAAYFTVGGEVVRTAVKNICHGKVFDENFLMSVATVGAFLIGEYPEAVLVMLLYQIGEMFQSYAVGKSRKSITALMDIRPDVAYIKLNDGSIVKKEPKDVRIGEIIVVKPGEKVALDGKLAKGEGTVDEAALTGESLPREVLAGDDIMSGSISVSGVLEIEVEKEFSQSTVSKILELVENAGKKKAKTEKFISKFARYYTPIVVFLALALGVIPPIIEGISDGAVWAKWVYRALNFLVISCPCALVISVPLSFFAGIGGASSKGILIKGSSHLEALAKCNMVVFDKTGTLTKGNFKVAEIKSVSGSPEDDSTLLEKAVRGELFSNHPIAVSLKKQLELRDKELYKKIISITDSSGYEEISGYGIKADINGEIIYVGSKKLMDKFGISYKTVETLGTVVYVACGNKSQQATCLGYIAISDEMKSDAKAAIDGLKKIGIDNTVMLTGDRKDIADFVGGELGIDKIFGELLPADKVERMENFISEKKPDETIAFAGDGINDAPVLARADIGIAMGGLGQDVAIEAADVVIMDDKPSNIVRAIKIARKTMRIARENIVFALLIKVGVLILAVMGIASMWYAVFADVGVCVIAILNALRALKIDSKNS